MTFKITSLSTIASNQTSTNSFLRIQNQMAEAQRQLATGVKETTFKGYGIQSLMIQEYRAELEKADRYIDNINKTETQIRQMDNALSELMAQLNIVTGQATIDPQEGEPDITGMQRLARNAREIMIDLMNTQIADRYLFAGSDVSNKPYETTANLDARISQELTDWKDQTNTAEEFLTNLDNITQSQAGFSLSIQSAGNIRARADDNFEVDYTVKANGQGFQDVIKALSVFIQLDTPDPDVDLATREQYYEIENTLTTNIIRSIDEMRENSSKIATAAQAIDRARQDHIDQRAQLLKLMEATESADAAEAATKFQSLSTQLQTSFQATSIVQQLNLANFL